MWATQPPQPLESHQATGHEHIVHLPLWNIYTWWFPICVITWKTLESTILYNLTQSTFLVLLLTTSQNKFFFSSQYLENPIAIHFSPPLSLFAYSPGLLTCIFHLFTLKSNLKFQPLYKAFLDYSSCLWCFFLWILIALIFHNTHFLFLYLFYIALIFIYIFCPTRSWAY